MNLQEEQESYFIPNAGAHVVHDHPAAIYMLVPGKQAQEMNSFRSIPIGIHKAAKSGMPGQKGFSVFGVLFYFSRSSDRAIVHPAGHPQMTFGIRNISLHE